LYCVSQAPCSTLTTVCPAAKIPVSDPPLHNRLSTLRAERGLSRRDLADVLRVNRQTIGYLERGDYSPSLALAFRVSQYFDLPIEAIFSPRPFEPLSSQVYHREKAPGRDEPN